MKDTPKAEVPPVIVYYDVVWSGRGAMPHEERDRGHWTYRTNALLEAAPGHDGYVSKKEVTNKSLSHIDREIVGRCRCGEGITRVRWRQKKRVCPACDRASRKK